MKRMEETGNANVKNENNQTRGSLLPHTVILHQSVIQTHVRALELWP